MRFAAILIALLLAAPAHAADLKVMSFNIWGGGANQGKGIEDTVAVLRASGADIIGIQETRLETDPCEPESCPPAGPSVAMALAKALGFHVHEQTAENPALWANAVLSRYPILHATPHDLGVAIDVDGKTVYAFNIQPTDYPYQPYQLRGLPYGDAPYIASETKAIAAAIAARGDAIDLLLAEVAEAKDAAATFIFGDFNEPSCLDWTSLTVAEARHPISVCFPASKRLLDAGFTDAYRHARPDEVHYPGYTWSAADPFEAHDRIDFIYARASGLKVGNATILGEKKPEADIVITPWPSDHRAVVATVTFD